MGELRETTVRLGIRKWLVGAACIYAAIAAADGERPKATPALQKRLMEQARHALRDPESARFSEQQLRRSDDPPAVALCGIVNAKNLYGGYVGAARFVSTSTGVVAFEMSEPGFPSIWEVWCSSPA